MSLINGSLASFQGIGAGMYANEPSGSGATASAAGTGTLIQRTSTASVVAANATFQWDESVVDNTTDYTYSAGVFTVTNGGVYLLSFTTLGSPSGVSYFIVRVNGATYERLSATPTSGVWVGFGTSLVAVNAGDEISIGVLNADWNYSGGRGNNLISIVKVV